LITDKSYRIFGLLHVQDELLISNELNKKNIFITERQQSINQIKIIRETNYEVLFNMYEIQWFFVARKSLRIK